MLVLPARRGAALLGAVGARRFAAGPVKYEALSVGIPKETFEREKRAAASPASVALLKKAGIGEVRVEAGAGLGASYSDAARVAARSIDGLRRHRGRAGRGRAGRGRAGRGDAACVVRGVGGRAAGLVG